MLIGWPGPTNTRGGKMPRERKFGRGKYHPPPPDPDVADTTPERVNETVSPVERAVRQFEQFVRDWTPPAVREMDSFDKSVGFVRGAIRRIAPAAEVRQIVGYAVFKMELDAKYNLVPVCVSPVFEKVNQVENSVKGFRERKEGWFVVCEVRQSLIGEPTKNLLPPRAGPVQIDEDGEASS